MRKPRFLRRLIPSVHPLDAENIGPEVRDVAFRMAEVSDHSTCLRIYRANEGIALPTGFVDQYLAALESPNTTTFIATRDGTDVGCCCLGDAHFPDGERVALFSFGLVEPRAQRRGVGTAQILMRMAQLEPGSEGIDIRLVALRGSKPFLQRLGFNFPVKSVANGVTIWHGEMRISRSFVEDCREELQERRITYPLL